MDKNEFITQSKAFEEVLAHRRTCKYWQNGTFMCVDCFGGGLSTFVDALAKEGLIKRLDKHTGDWY